MPSDTTSPTLISRVRDPADAVAWAEFERRYGELILRYCGRRGLAYFDADDVRQMVMLRLMKALRARQYNPALGRFRAFLGRIIQNEISRYRRRPNPAGPWVISADTSLVADPRPDVADSAWEQEWTEHHLRVAMRRLRDAHDARSLQVFDRLLSGRGVEEVALEFRMSTEAVHKVKQRIRDRLRELVAAQIRDEEGPHA